MAEAPRIVFEAVKMAMRQDKDGVSLVLRVHPNDVTPEMMQVWVGQRVGVAMVPIADDDSTTLDSMRDGKKTSNEEKYKKEYEKLLGKLVALDVTELWLQDVHNYDTRQGIKIILEHCVQSAIPEALSDIWYEKLNALLKIENLIKAYVA